ASAFVRLRNKAPPFVVACRAGHDHSIAKAQLRVSDAVAVIRHNKIFPEPKNAAKPFNRRRRVAITKAGYNRSRHRFDGTRLRHSLNREGTGAYSFTMTGVSSGEFS